jgi:hypothetical protein
MAISIAFSCMYQSFIEVMCKPSIIRSLLQGLCEIALLQMPDKVWKTKPTHDEGI